MCVVCLFLFKVSNLFIFPGRPSSSVWNVASGSQPCHPQSQTICVLQAQCALQYRCFLWGAQMIFLMESRRPARWQQFPDASLRGNLLSRIEFQHFVTLCRLVCELSMPMPAKLSEFMSAPCTLELHRQVLQWVFKILFRTLMDDKNRYWSFQF